MPRSPQRDSRNYSRGLGASPSREENRNRCDPSPRLAGRIDTILGGRAGGGDSRNSRKNYARRDVYSFKSSAHVCVESISFSNAELQDIEMPYDHPFVIARVIVNYTMDRMLVDTSSSANTLYLSTYD
ncbi:hypothetical protein LIER_26829 [Lithospermum erythrorhizon]|uniref:Uncharacterized protein n=1 Tax=Lithospermum erythrorhizon TaxID=34254 RepID=A0AAV3RBV2_LITER